MTTQIVEMIFDECLYNISDSTASCFLLGEYNVFNKLIVINLLLHDQFKQLLMSRLDFWYCKHCNNIFRQNWMILEIIVHCQ